MLEQHLEGTLAVDHRVVFAVDSALLDDVEPLSLADGTDLRERKEDFRAFHHRWCTFFVEERDERLARFKVHDGFVGLERRVRTERVGGGFHGFLVFRRIGAQGVLHAVSELSEHDFGDVRRALGDEIDAHALRANQSDDLFDFVEQRLRRVGEQHVCLVEEEYEFRHLHVAHLGQRAVELGKQPEQERGIEFRLHHQLVGGQHVHDALAAIGLHQVVDVERRLTEEFVGSLRLQLQQCALDGSHRCCRHVAVLHLVFLCVLRHVVEHRAQVFQVEQQHVRILLCKVVGNAEDDVEHAVLRLVQSHQSRQQLRSHLRNGGTHRVSLLAIDVEKAHGASLEELRVES